MDYNALAIAPSISIPRGISMELIRNILDHKGYELYSTVVSAAVADALRSMTERNIGSLLVFDGSELLGIFTERDYVRWAARGGAGGAERPVGDVMDRRVHRIAPEQRVDEAMERMTSKRVRHLVVEEYGRIVGLVSIGDVVHAVISSQASEIDHLHRYIQGEGGASLTS
jgi:CBS domain-containing protein